MADKTARQVLRLFHPGEFRGCGSSVCLRVNSCPFAVLFSRLFPHGLELFELFFIIPQLETYLCLKTN
jgi:hypothetical protein